MKTECLAGNYPVPKPSSQNDSEVDPLTISKKWNSVRGGYSLAGNRHTSENSEVCGLSTINIRYHYIEKDTTKIERYNIPKIQDCV